MDYKYRIQLSVNGTEIDLDAIRQLFPMAFRGSDLEVTGDSSQVTISYCCNDPWRVLEFCSTFGDMHHITVVNIPIEGADGV